MALITETTITTAEDIELDDEIVLMGLIWDSLADLDFSVQQRVLTYLLRRSEGEDAEDVELID